MFKLICSKVDDPITYQNLNNGALYSLCFLENVFPPFFDLMIHLVVHLVDELEIFGLVHSQWICSIEWSMKDLKRYVRNLCKPKSNMAEGYFFMRH
jgi:hypothetical protein